MLSRPSLKVPLRIQRMILQPQDYDFDIEYVKSEQNIIKLYQPLPEPTTETYWKNGSRQVCCNFVTFVTSTAVSKAFVLEDVTITTK